MHKLAKKLCLPNTPAIYVKTTSGGGGGEDPAFVRSKIAQLGSSETTTVPITLDAAVGSGNCLIVVVHSVGANGAPDTCTITDNQSNTYTIIDSHQNTAADYNTYTAYCSNITNAPTTVTATLSVARAYRAIYVMEVSHIKASSPLDGHAIASVNSNTTANGLSSGSITPTTDGDFIFGYCVDAGGHGIDAITSGFTADIAESGSFYSEYKLQTTAASIAATFTSSHSFVQSTNTVIAFKKA